MPTFECPTCHKVVTLPCKEDAPYRPFCCQRCKLVDLGRWLDGTYNISEPAAREESEDLASEDDQGSR